MRPHIHQENPQHHLPRDHLENITNKKHELLESAHRIEWLKPLRLRGGPPPVEQLWITPKQVNS